ncbi:MAG TPA: NUDIX hydrolase [Candidatus Saccharimonadales bacterium]|jgi:8-oxo-dGTP pyrophosphatase MutT (NUDIX family)|nr:NUDIX hydrolase [Candidatus Saccharimonadales bacterium]
MKTINREIVGAFILSNDQHVLLGKSRKSGVYQGVWVVPGGIEPGETHEEAMKRETWEEVGLDTAPAVVTALLDDVLEGESEKTIQGENVLVKMRFHDFLVEFPLPASEIAFDLQEELAEAAWILLDTLSADMLAPGVAYRLRQLGYIQ